MEIARLNEALDHERGVRRALISMVGREPVMGSDEWSTLRHDIAHVGAVLRADLAHIRGVVQGAQEATVNALKPLWLPPETAVVAGGESDPPASAAPEHQEGPAPDAGHSIEDALDSVGAIEPENAVPGATAVPSAEGTAMSGIEVPQDESPGVNPPSRPSDPLDGGATSPVADGDQDGAVLGAPGRRKRTARRNLRHPAPERSE